MASPLGPVKSTWMASQLPVLYLSPTASMSIFTVSPYLYCVALAVMVRDGVASLAATYWPRKKPPATARGSLQMSSSVPAWAAIARRRAWAARFTAAAAIGRFLFIDGGLLRQRSAARFAMP